MECDGKLSAKSNAWEEGKLVIRVEGGRWFITKHPQAFRFSQGVLDEEDIEQAMGWGGRDGRLGVTPLRGCCGATVATQRCVTA
jgi:hypothetical protein